VAAEPRPAGGGCGRDRRADHARGWGKGRNGRSGGGASDELAVETGPAGGGCGRDEQDDELALGGGMSD
jgi:hypothetical protein